MMCYFLVTLDTSYAQYPYLYFPPSPFCLHRFFNSPMMPNWKELLPITNSSDGSEDEEDAMTATDDADFTEQLKKFKEGFDIFIEEEKLKANISYHCNPDTIMRGGGFNFEVTVLREIAEGQELLRPYGKEWLAIKYFHLKSGLLGYLESMQEDKYDGQLIISIDVKLLQVSVWEFKKKVIDDGVDTNDELGRYLSFREGKEMIVLSPEELNSLANMIGMLAVEYLDTEDDDYFASTWKDNVDHIRSHFPRAVVHPATWKFKAKKKSSSKKRKAKNAGQVEKLKHGAFDVYKMKE